MRPIGCIFWMLVIPTIADALNLTSWPVAFMVTFVAAVVLAVFHVMTYQPARRRGE